MKHFLGWIVIALVSMVACKQHVTTGTENSEPQFQLLQADNTGLDFANTLQSSSDFNVFHYMYFYNGGGVAVADFNQDGLTDIFFTANMDSNALFLNEGGLKFKDVTTTANVLSPQGWTTGACAVDINQDGMMDIYVSRLGDYRNVKGANQLFVCTGVDAQGIPRFEDKAAEYGLQLVGFGTQASFFDYDKDGDLDMYQLNHSVHNNGTFGQRKVFLGTMHALSGDKLLRNDNGKFVDVTATSGINSSVIGYGLGIATSDINLDGWPDIYICNDFHENDYLYLNQHDGTFKEVLTEQIQHTSRFSMGVDIADINNDGYNEIFTLDMHPYDPAILKSALGEDGYGTFQFKLGYGYNHQFARNMLQLNNRDETFSEIALLAGVFNTDWSWAAFFIDFDHDGYKDLFVSNGIAKRMNDIDYVNFLSNQEVQWKIRMDELETKDLALEKQLPEVKIENKFFRNTGKLTFSEDRVGNTLPSFSNGAAYADFDQDGDLDIVVNNIGDAPFLYQNMEREKQSDGAWLSLKLKGRSPNRDAIGAKVIAYRGDEQLVKENYPVTGYQSSVEYGIHLGLGALDQVDSILLIWPDGTYQPVENKHCNTTATIEWKEGLPEFPVVRYKRVEKDRVIQQDITAASGLNFTHIENPFVEFDREPLIPHMTSAEGPALTTGDLNGDGREDVFIGGAKHQPSAVFYQNASGTFDRQHFPALHADSLYEDVDAVIGDFDGDGDADLVVASGGNEFRNGAAPLTQRLYRNLGSGSFVRDTTAFPGIHMTASCVVPNDVDQDGDLDIFLGGRAEPWQYGVIPRSYLLLNDGKGRFTDNTANFSEALMYAGHVKDAVWTDLDGDSRQDLIIAAEWSPLQIFYNGKDGWKRVHLVNSDGFWNCVAAADIDGDGDQDFVAGNLGLNSELKVSPDQPVRMYVADYDGNERKEQLVTYYLGGQEVLFPTYAEIVQQIPSVKKKYLFARDFAKATVPELVGAQHLESALKYKVVSCESAWFENAGNGKFIAHALPQRMQFAPIRAVCFTDVDGNGGQDLVAMGNFYEANIEMGRYDADYGTILFQGTSSPETWEMQSMHIEGQVRNIRHLKGKDGELLILAKNNAAVQVLQLSHGQPDL